MVEERSLAACVSSPFLQPEFIASLYQKLCELRTRAKEAPTESIAGALWFYRYWMVECPSLKEMLAGTRGALRKHLQEVLDRNNAHCCKCEKLLIREMFQIYRTGDLFSYQRFGAIFTHIVKYQTGAYKLLDWPECFCAVLLQS